MESQNEIVVASGMAVEKPVASFVAVAVNGTEMIKAKAGIQSWLENKLRFIDEETAELQAVYDSAVRHKWKSSTFKSQLAKKGQERLYYGKILAACEAGFTIVPNMDVSVFAIRRKDINSHYYDSGESKYNYVSASPSIPEADEQRLPVGQGQYVSPEYDVRTINSTTTNEKNEKIYNVEHIGSGFEQIEFPLAIAQPMVMDATAQAMALKIFDRIGIVPMGMRKRRGDPIVLGQITRKVGYETKRCSFLIAWYLDPRTL